MKRRLDPRALTPAELSMLTAKTAGRAVSAARVSELAALAAAPLGRKGRIDAIRWCAWLADCEAKGKFPAARKTEKPAGDYADQSERQNALMREKRKSIRDISSWLAENGYGHAIPEPANPERRESCRNDLAKYLRTYHANAFPCPFSTAHERVIRRIEVAAMQGGRFLDIVFRGFGKTTIAECSAIWAVDYGHRKFVPVVGADKDASKKNIDAIKTEYEANDTLAEDFPEICLPIRALEGINHRCGGQLYQGDLTNIEWNANTIVLPMIPGSIAAGAIIGAFSMLGRIRGLKHKRVDGVVLRPDLYIVDDPQTDKSASSEAETAKRFAIMQKGILRGAGHQKRAAVVVPCTIIEQNDLICRLRANPAWQSECIPMLQARAEREEDLWLGEYARLRTTYDADDPEDQARAHAEATAFYEAHREEMDRGAVATWEHCFDETEISAIQHAYNILIDEGPEVFASECQNDPTVKDSQSLYEMDPALIAKRVSGLKRLQAPESAAVLTAFIDVGWSKLHFAAAAWDERFSGDVVQYGIFPRGNAVLYDSQKNVGMIDETMRLKPCTLIESVTFGLKALLREITDMEFRRGDGERMMLDRIAIDCGDPHTRDAVFSVTAGERWGVPVIASRGRAHKRFSVPKTRKVRVYLDAFQDYWRGGGRVLVHDACLWRERTQNAWLVPEGGAGGLRLYGDGKANHLEFAGHMANEVLREKFAGDTGEYYVWQEPPPGPQHWLDCVVGCAVLAGVEGVRYAGVTRVKAKRGKTGGKTLGQMLRG